ncbi:MAG: hypothetical protein JXD23_00505 [Spirochaetales bacterium]|nr:hypothetical protein [Spirochaetales bacterium]
MRLRLFACACCIGLGSILALGADDVVITTTNLAAAIENSRSGAGPDVIGWSKKGRMACVDYVQAPEPDGRADVYVRVVDLITDSVVYSRQCGRSDNGFTLNDSAVRAAAAQLNRLGVFYAPTVKQRFPVLLEDEVVTLTVSEEPIAEEEIRVRGTGPGDGSAGKTKLTLAWTKERAKMTKRFVTTLTGPCVIGDEEGVVSYYRSPYENRIAVAYHAGAYRQGDTIVNRGDNGFIGCNLGVGFK